MDKNHKNLALFNKLENLNTLKKIVDFTDDNLYKLRSIFLRDNETFIRKTISSDRALEKFDQKSIKLLSHLSKK